MNEVANLCDEIGVDIENVRLGIGSDPRIGHAFIYAGAGYGGSCFPKDVRALVHAAKSNGVDPLLLDATHLRNQAQKHYLVRRVKEHFADDLSGRVFAVWGLSFKPGTDDVREAPSIEVVRGLLDAGATVRAFDPVAAAAFAKRLSEERVDCSRFSVVPDKYQALEGADALLLVTEWKEFRSPDFSRMKALLKQSFSSTAGISTTLRACLPRAGPTVASAGRLPRSRRARRCRPGSALGARRGLVRHNPGTCAS
jgi:UDPglucose 6-dehydrogenase